MGIVELIICVPEWPVSTHEIRVSANTSEKRGLYGLFDSDFLANPWRYKAQTLHTSSLKCGLEMGIVELIICVPEW